MFPVNPRPSVTGKGGESNSEPFVKFGGGCTGITTGISAGGAIVARLRGATFFGARTVATTWASGDLESFGRGGPLARPAVFRAGGTLFFLGGLFAPAGLREATARAAYPGSARPVPLRVRWRNLA